MTVSMLPSSGLAMQDKLPVPPPVFDALERPLRDLRLSVTDICNFRCLYCMPPGPAAPCLSEGEVLTQDEIRRIALAFVSLGVRRIRITGGEPLLRRDLDRIISDLSSLRGLEELTLTTNGHWLADRARELAASGLSRVTVSLDAIDPVLFRSMTGGRGNLERVLRGIRSARDAGLNPVKVNCVLQRGHNECQIIPLARWARQEGVTLRFIEFMDVGNRNGWNPEQVVPSEEVLARLTEEFSLYPLVPRFQGEVAERYGYSDGGGEVGFVSSVTQPFCGNCIRGRVAADGVLYTCLFSGTGTDLRGLLRGGASDQELFDAIRRVWLRRTNRYSEERNSVGPRRHSIVEMNRMGG